MEIIKWVLSHHNNVQVQLSTFCGDLEIEMRNLLTQQRTKILICENDLQAMGYNVVEVLDFMYDELLQYEMRI